MDSTSTLHYNFQYETIMIFQITQRNELSLRAPEHKNQIDTGEKYKIMIASSPLNHETLLSSIKKQ
jgi:hypothetical protein